MGKLILRAGVNLVSLPGNHPYEQPLNSLFNHNSNTNSRKPDYYVAFGSFIIAYAGFGVFEAL